MSDLKEQALALYSPPFRYMHGYIFDSEQRMVADDAGGPAALRVRGWGRIQYLGNAEVLQDAVGELIAQALTEFWERETVKEVAA